MGIASSMRRRRKLGEIVAERIVEDIIRRGWNEGEVLGTEADLMERFRISRATFREAARQLEWQGAAGMRRGASGGLTVRAPPRDAIVSALKTYLELTGVDRSQRDAVRRTLEAAPHIRNDAGPNAAIALFLEALDTRSVADLARERSEGADAPKLSEATALRLVDDLQRSGATPGSNLGNESDLQERYGVSRAVMREALRLLELHRVVRVKTGASGGIIVDRCDPDYTVGLTSTFLACARIPLSHLWEAHSCLELAAIGGFVLRADPGTMKALGSALVRLERAPASHYLSSAQQFHQIIADHCGNAVLALFVGVMLTFGPTVLPQPDERFLPELKAQHRQLLRTVAEGDAEVAAGYMQAMFDHSRRWIAGIERAIDERAARGAPA